MSSTDIVTRDVVAGADRVYKNHRLPLFARIRFQLGGAVVAGGIVPVVIQDPDIIMTPSLLFGADVLPVLSANPIAVVIGYLLVRQFSPFSGRLALGYVLPALLFSFAATETVLAYFRVEHSWALVAWAYALSSSWLLFAYTVRNRYAFPILAVVPIGAVGHLKENSHVNWRPLTSPSDQLDLVDAMVVDHRADLPPEWDRFVTSCVLAGVPVYDVRHAEELLTGRVEVETLEENSFSTLLPSKTYHQIKRLLDIAMALIALPLFTAVILVTAVFIKLETPGPVIFTQPRMGYRGKIFTMYKLRSMRTGSPAAGQFTLPEDPRITRVGRFIRKYRIDEYPQIFNVLKGDMSWIGPRPEAAALAEWYAREVPFYMYRHSVRPGLTGWAQVNQGNVAELDAATEKLQYDFYYTKYFSPALDLIIVFRTLRTILTGFGSR